MSLPVEGHQWLRHEDKYQFRCPACGELYRPWSGHKDAVNFQYVIGITSPEDGLHKFIPATWPPSEEAGWVSKQVELHASQIRTEDDVVAWNQRTKKNLMDLFAAQSIPMHFQQHP